jgi:hypothetical protein
MFTQMLTRGAVALGFVALVSGCSSTKTGPGDTASAASGPRTAVSQSGSSCRSLLSRCGYEGSYDAGEKEYAEQEAKRLNAAELARLRRAFGN